MDQHYTSYTTATFTCNTEKGHRTHLPWLISFTITPALTGHQPPSFNAIECYFEPPLVDRVAPDVQLALQAELHVHQDSVLALQAHSGIVMGPIVVILLVFRFTFICVNKAFIKSTVFFLEASPRPGREGLEP